MNIFVSDPSPIKSALWLDDKRVIKMILESTQMLCTAVNENGGQTPYKSTHINHPSNVWARASGGNWHWLWDHAMELCDRYQAAYNKIHKCREILLNLSDECYDKYIPKGPITPFANCAAHSGKGISYKHVLDVPEAYKAYLIDRWNTDVKPPTWTKRPVPSWAKLLDNGKFMPHTVAAKVLFEEV